ncbi:uncharacterized protein LOC127847246 [Dreissena polymorpha]|uniref:Fork-head domain-containing protein n=1 Tax=Dreissena polymorpha TaxID=45954 RepID=A0A9D4DHG3_DREPO|nr:uncharacterized protein LOC127847246 [Dreissena polymorpha]KAH3748575.1 hypothetical protein DPMN_183021 [Dreissena polymorpha]
MKRKFAAGDGASMENPAKIMLPGSSGDMFQNSYGSPLIGKPMSASTPVGETGSRRQVHVASSSSGIGALRMHHSLRTSAMDAAEVELRRVIDNFVNVYEQLDRSDSAAAKPNYSYTELAFLAMLRSPNFCLPITEIYRYIQARFQFYKHSTRKHWKNAVRHSLAKTLCFTKITVGRGASNSEKLARSTYLWCIIPSSISCFARGDYRPSTNADGDPGTNTLRWGYYNANAEKFWLEVGDYVANKMAAFKNLVRESQTPGLVFEAQVCRLSVNDVQSHRQPLHTRNLNLGSSQTFSEHHNHQFGTGLGVCTPSQVESNTMASAGSSMNMRSTENANQYYQIDANRQLHGPTGVTRIRGYDNSCENHMTSSCDFEDPWMPRFTLQSPELSFNGVDPQRCTPPYTSGEHHYDSGFETCDSSPNDSSCRMLADCSRQQNNILNSPSLLYDNFDSSILSNDCIGDLNRLSPFSLSDFSETGHSFNPVNASSQSQASDDSYGQRSFSSPCMAFQSHPCAMTSDARYTYRIGAEFSLPSPPPYPNGQISTRLQPGLVENGEPIENTKPYSQPSWQQTRRYTGTHGAPILVINADGTVTSSSVRLWNACAFSS